MFCVTGNKLELPVFDSWDKAQHKGNSWISSLEKLVVTLPYNSQVLYCRSQGPPVWYDVRAPRTSSDYKCLLRCQDPEGENHRQGRTPMGALTLPTSKTGHQGFKNPWQTQGKERILKKGHGGHSFTTL